MFDKNTYTISEIDEKHIPSEQIDLANKNPITTSGRDRQGYSIQINEFALEPIPTNVHWGLLEARLSGCNYLIKNLNYKPNSIFKSICYTGDREIDPQECYFQVVKR
ncbi:hypothetical protein [Peribacillus loiseleuriae]|uniref:Uncharacterized protein n=1 Tax=Peribacillus loiseleuriae TaxID=1679170 RepID=A0A0K9GSI8_9BACI|nr:hypothetical protein [Peribacillus loiseleuriae]KMY49576.1 hypothetical protein AC625_08485 [Peribacillus loiseleuriae]